VARPPRPRILVDEEPFEVGDSPHNGGASRLFETEQDGMLIAGPSMTNQDSHVRAIPVAVLLDNVRSMYNVGAFFRAADGVGLEKLCLCGITAHPGLGLRIKKAITKTALGAEETVQWEHDWDAVHMAEDLRGSGFQIAAIETKPEGTDSTGDFGVDLGVDLYDWQPKFPVCVMFGHEVDGLRPELLAIADAHVRIPMLGQKKSLNVATAGGVVMYELLRKYRQNASCRDALK
jgi:23S rRNA (guanosine2251-2'-O)-methyltransferase